MKEEYEGIGEIETKHCELLTSKTKKKKLTLFPFSDR